MPQQKERKISDRMKITLRHWARIAKVAVIMWGAAMIVI